MSEEELLNNYCELIDKGYCEDCNELNCLDNFPQNKIVVAIRNLQQELSKSEETNKKVIAYIKEHLELKNYSNQKYEYFSREFLEELLKILEVEDE